MSIPALLILLFGLDGQVQASHKPDQNTIVIGTVYNEGNKLQLIVLDSALINKSIHEPADIFLSETPSPGSLEFVHDDNARAKRVLTEIGSVDSVVQAMPILIKE